VALGAVGCGVFDDDDGGGAGKDKSGLLVKPEDTTSKAVPGGRLRWWANGDTPSFDGLSAASGIASVHNGYTYARLVQSSKVFNLAKGEKFDASVEPYAAQSWEQSGDGLQLTFKLQPNGGLDPRPPTSGRLLDAQDVVFSYNRFKATHRGRTSLVNELNKDAPVLSVTAVDSRTVVVKLAYPSVSVLQQLGHWLGMPLQPREADGGFDARTTMRGSGPWMLDEYKPSQSFSYKRNPSFYRTGRPFMEGLDLPIISEYAQGAAQLKAGGLDLYFLRGEDILPTKSDVPSLNMYQFVNFPSRIFLTFFSFKPGSIWQDERLRQALSLLMDRDLIIDTTSNAEKFRSQGLPLPTRWNTLIPTGDEPFWLDPQGSDFGANARYFKYDPAEAKKLVQASGRGPTVAADWNIVGSPEFGPEYRQNAELFKGVWEAGSDFKFRTVAHDYTTVFAPKFNLYPAGGRQFDGLGLMAPAPFPDPDLYLLNYYMPGAPASKFELDYPKDAQWESLVRAQSIELDAKKRLSIIQDLQRLHAGKMYTISGAGTAREFWLWNPRVMNVGAYASRFFDAPASAEFVHFWLDASKS